MKIVIAKLQIGENVWELQSPFFYLGGAAKAFGELNHSGHGLASSPTLPQLHWGLLEDAETIWHGAKTKQPSTTYCPPWTWLSGISGMCCFNLSLHRESIHHSIQFLNDQVKKIQAESGGEWIGELLGGWGLKGWHLSLVKTVLWVLIVIVVMLILISCLRKICGGGFSCETQRGSCGGPRTKWLKSSLHLGEIYK